MERYEVEMNSTAEPSRIGSRKMRGTQSRSQDSRRSSRNQRPTTAPASSSVCVHNPEALLQLFGDDATSKKRSGRRGEKTQQREARVRGCRHSENSTIKVHNPQALASLFDFDESSTGVAEDVSIAKGLSSPRPGSGKSRNEVLDSFESPQKVSDSVRQSRQQYFQNSRKPASQMKGHDQPSPTHSSPRPRTTDGTGAEHRQVPDDVFERILRQRRLHQQKQQQANIEAQSRPATARSRPRSRPGTARSSPSRPGTAGSRPGTATARSQLEQESSVADAVLRATAETTLATIAAEQMAAFMEAKHLGVEKICLEKVQQQASVSSSSSAGAGTEADETDNSDGFAKASDIHFTASTPLVRGSPFRVSSSKSMQRLADAKMMDELCQSVDATTIS